VKGFLLLPRAARWAAGSAFLVLALAGHALAAGTISGKVTAPSGKTLENAKVAATSAKFDVYRADVGDDGTYMIEDAVAGTYTLSVIASGLSVPDVKDVVLKDGQTLTQDFKAEEAKPFCVVKSPRAIRLDEDIDSDAFKDAPEILVNSGKNLGVGPPEEFGKDGGAALVSGRFKLKYSDSGLHMAADVTFKTPLVNNQKDDNLWNGNALEFDLQNDPYTVDRTDKDADHDWQVVVGLGTVADWWLHGSVNARPKIDGKETKIDTYIQRQQNDHGEKFRLDMPWKIFLAGGPDGKGISMPADNALGAVEVVLDVVDPNAARSEAVRKYQIQWSGFGNSHWNASSLVPVQFCPQPPAAGQ